MLGLKRGDRSGDARDLQRWLTLHYGARLPASGHMCPLTVGALRRYQAAHGLTVTGEVDEATWAKIEAEQSAYRARIAGAGAVLPLAPAIAPES